MLIAVHCEDKRPLENSAKMKSEYGEDLPIRFHPLFEVKKLLQIFIIGCRTAKKHNTRLHILHISTDKYVQFVSKRHSSKSKRITAEACIHHLLFDESSYDEKELDGGILL